MRYFFLLTTVIVAALGCGKDEIEVMLPESIEIAKTYIPELDKLSILTNYSIRDESGHGISSLSADGEDLYALHYTGRQKLLKFNFNSSRWENIVNDDLNYAINKISGKHTSPGGFSIHGDTLWVSNSYGSSYGAILKSTGEIIYEHEIGFRTQAASQSYSGIEFNFPFVYLAYHSYFYADINDLQTLLKFDIRTEELVSETTLLTDSNQRDGTHGLTFTENRLWHVRNNRLSQIDPEDGSVVHTYALKGIIRPSGIAFLNSSLFIVTFEGDLYRLPLK